jgi:hypothetical protein
LGTGAQSIADDRSMEVPVTRTIPLALAGLSLMGCNGAFWGNLVVLGVTVGIFFGTLALGRASAATRSASSSASSSSSTRR